MVDANSSQNFDNSIYAGVEEILPAKSQYDLAPAAPAHIYDAPGAKVNTYDHIEDPLQ